MFGEKKKQNGPLNKYYDDKSRQDDFFAGNAEYYCKAFARYCFELCLFEEN